MPLEINLNADMGEGWGVYDIGNDAALIRVVRSASVACGFHAGDWNTMHRLCELAKAHACSIGAHPGFNDLWGFGRRPMRMSPTDIERMVAYQIGALKAIARYSGLRVTHLKPHGALSNMAVADESYALAVGRAIKAVDPRLIYVVHPASAMERAARKLRLRRAREGYADRTYEEDLQLTPRTDGRGLIRDPKLAAEQAVRMAVNREVVTRTGKVVPIEVDTICVHGDVPGAVAVAEAVAGALRRAGVAIVPLPDLACLQPRRRRALNAVVRG
ncbi:MAG TPA: 5-oxoprolinase subunit PxpA [Hyphomicrobiaceae bacterium]|nr:5-oxoprolinase subunit PxpA [Hyphomicrobiaceae bacterium]